MAMLGETVMARAIRGDALVGGFRVRVFPLVLGKGKRLFEDGVPPLGLTLVESRSTSKGVLLNSYRTSALGPFQNGHLNPTIRLTQNWHDARNWRRRMWRPLYRACASGIGRLGRGTTAAGRAEQPFVVAQRVAP